MCDSEDSSHRLVLEFQAFLDLRIYGAQETFYEDETNVHGGLSVIHGNGYDGVIGSNKRGPGADFF